MTGVSHLRLLGCALVHPEFASTLVDSVGGRVDVFEASDYQALYRVIRERVTSGRDLAPNLVAVDFRRGGGVQDGVVAMALWEGSSLQGIGEVLASVLESWRWSRMKALAGRMAVWSDAPVERHGAGIETPEDLAAAVLEELRAITDEDESGRDRPVTAAGMLRRASDYRAVIDGTAPPGWKLGIEGLDNVLTLRPGGLYVVGALNKAGKSKLQVWIGHRLASFEIPVLDLSLEMGRDLRWDWYVSRHLGLESEVIGTASMPRESVERLLLASHPIYELSLTVDDRPSRTLQDVAFAVQAWRAGSDRYGIVLLDYLQLMNLQRERGESEATALSRTAKGLADIARRQEVAIVATAQLNRTAEDEEPGPQHLEGSGGIAQAAMAMVFLDNLVRRGRGSEAGGPSKTPVAWRVVQRAGRAGRGRMIADLTTGRFCGADPSDEWLFETPKRGPSLKREEF